MSKVVRIILKAQTVSDGISLHQNCTKENFQIIAMQLDAVYWTLAKQIWPASNNKLQK